MEVGEEVDRRGNMMDVHHDAGQVPTIAVAVSSARTSICQRVMSRALTVLLSYQRGIVLLRTKGPQ